MANQVHVGVDLLLHVKSKGVRTSTPGLIPNCRRAEKYEGIG